MIHNQAEMNLLTRDYPIKTRVWHHALFWLVLLLFNVSRFQRNFVGYSFDVFRTNLLSELVELPVLILASYFTGYFLLQNFFIRRKYVQFFSWLAVSSVLFALLLRVLIYYIEIPVFYADQVSDGHRFLHFNIIQHIFYIYSTAGVFFMLRLVKHLLKIQESKTQLERQSMKSELALLRSQINPHFLFNTLNNINSLIQKNKDKASFSVVKLSDIMRYMLYDANRDMVFLSDEIDYINNYIELQRIRLEQPDHVNVYFEGSTAGIKIPPMLFIPFIENMFKHGDKNAASPGFRISLKISSSTIHFQTQNTIRSTNGSTDDTTGIGIANVKRRLDLIYPGHYKLDIEKQSHIFTVDLKIDLKTNVQKR